MSLPTPLSSLRVSLPSSSSSRWPPTGLSPGLPHDSLYTHGPCHQGHPDGVHVPPIEGRGFLGLRNPGGLQKPGRLQRGERRAVWFPVLFWGVRRTWENMKCARSVLGVCRMPCVLSHSLDPKTDQKSNTRPPGPRVGGIQDTNSNRFPEGGSPTGLEIPT